MIIAVRAFPPKESFNSLVIFDSRYGTWEDFRFGSPRALMTLPSARRPLLMCTDSVEYGMIMHVDEELRICEMECNKHNTAMRLQCHKIGCRTVRVHKVGDSLKVYGSP